MGFRFRKSVKIAPGVKVNFGKRGTSLTVGNKYARTTFGNGRQTNSISFLARGFPTLPHKRPKEKNDHRESLMSLLTL